MTAPRPPSHPLSPQTAAPAGIASTTAAASDRPIASESLFAGCREVQILHRGSLYRLKQTALGKLILTK